MSGCKIIIDTFEWVSTLYTLTHPIYVLSFYFIPTPSFETRFAGFDPFRGVMCTKLLDYLYKTNEDNEL